MSEQCGECFAGDLRKFYLEKFENDSFMENVQ